jgi:Tol biopolymer transport system component
MGIPLIGNVKAVDREHIFVVNADGSGLTQLTPDDVRAVSPSWSPDGHWIAFATRPDYYADPSTSAAYIIKADGACWEQITPAVAERTYAVVWSPYDAQIALVGQKAPGFYSSEPVRDTIALFDTASRVITRQIELDENTLPAEPMGKQVASLPTWRPLCALQEDECSLQSFPVLEALLSHK